MVGVIFKMFVIMMKIVEMIVVILDELEEVLEMIGRLEVKVGNIPFLV